MNIHGSTTYDLKEQAKAACEKWADKGIRYLHVMHERDVKDDGIKGEHNHSKLCFDSQETYGGRAK